MNDKQRFVVTFHNPAVGKVERSFATRVEAQDRVQHYEAKYGAFDGYKRAEIREETA